MEPVAPDERLWIRYSRERALPVSAIISAAIHLALLAMILLGVLSLFGPERSVPIEFEPVFVMDAPGGGQRGTDERTRPGLPDNPVDAAGTLDDDQRNPLPKVASQAFPDVRPNPDAETLVAATNVDSHNPLERRIQKLAPIQSLQPLLRGLPAAPPASSGGIARGSGQGSGTGPGVGPGDGSAGRLTQKQRRQLRWTLLFNIRSAPDYLDQLHRLKAIIGVQYPDKSIKLITNLKQRPAKLDPADRIPDRIFWVDENAEAVRSMGEELGIKPLPWRVIAFFPATIEDELWRKEQAYGKRFGRESEDDIQETVFRVEERYGNVDISVVRQQGR